MKIKAPIIVMIAGILLSFYNVIYAINSFIIYEELKFIRWIFIFFILGLVLLYVLFIYLKSKQD